MEIRQLLPTPFVFGTPVGVDPVGNPPRYFASETDQVPWLVWRLCVATFSRFSRTPTCDRHTQTGRQRVIALL